MGHEEQIGLAAGDHGAFERLYDRLGARLYAAARRLVDRSEGAEDLVQEVFVSLARARSSLVGVRDLDGYVFTILRNAAGRRRRLEALQRSAAAIAARTIPSASPPPRHADDALAAAVARLPVSQREVLALRIDGGLSFAEIATTLGLSINTVASRYRYAVSRLRAELGPSERPHPSTPAPLIESCRSELS